MDFEITGNFIGYIKFKRALSISKKMLNFDKESIQVVKGDTTGAIKVSGTLTIVGLADDFFKTLTSLIIISLLLVGNSMSDSHDNEQNIIEKAKEINKEVKKEQALKSAEEPLPLNDPFVGDASMSGRTEVTLLENNQTSNEPKSGESLYNFKLVGVVASESMIVLQLL